MKTLFKNANLIDETGEVKTNLDLLVADGVIADIGENLCRDDAEVIDCTDRFITPGFVSMHCHTPMNIFKGIAEDVNIDDWFNKELWPYESKMQDEDIYWGAKLACAEMINNGVTAFADHYFKGHLIAQACEETGIKGDIAWTIFGFGGDCSEELARATKFCEDYKNAELVNPRMGPHSPYMCSPAVLKEIVDKAKELGVGIHLHVSETKAQVDTSKELHGGKTPFEVVNDAGGFDVPCIVGHGLWVEEEDLKYINEKTVFAVSPKTYTKLGMGAGGLWTYKDKINIASGNDGSASSNSIDVVKQMRMFALLGKWDDNAEGFTLKEIWQYMMNGHKYLNFNSGKLQKGCAADLNIFNLNTVATAPVYNPLAAIIYSSVPSVNITDVMINGKFVKRNGKLAFDEKEIVEKASACAKEIYARGRGVTKLYF
ncbi:MAG: amidohydrolase family protein [Oscillospiraceae bacterium]|nr:amidohydrolase family protein [Oscillospiraceae bacterium]